MLRFRGPEARLLAATLRPEARAFGGVMALLVVALSIKLALPILLARFVDRAVAGAEVSSLTTLAVTYVVAALAAEAIQLLVAWVSVQLSWKSGNRLRERLSAHAMELEMSWHGRYSPGQLIERIDGDVEAMVVFFTNVLVHVVGNVCLAVGMIAVAFTIDPRAGIVLSITAGIGAWVLFRLRSAAVPAREHEREVNAVLYGDLEERLGGLEDLRANGAGRYAVHRLHRNSALSWRAARRASLLGDSAYAISAVTFALGSVAILVLGFSLREIVTVGQVIALFRYSELMRQPLEVIAEQLKEFHKAIAGARRAAQLLSTERTITGGAAEPIAVGSGAPEVHFTGVTLRYHTDGIPAVRDIELVVPPGSHLGIVGRTGSGKTTLGRLVLRLWDADEGSVLIGGVNVRDLSDQALRSVVSVVTQDVEVLRASLRDNLTLFGAREATDRELETTLDRVGLHRWRKSLSSGLDTELDGLTSLSAGEAQLLAFARAFLTDPGVVVLDEASSRLDPVTESLVAATTRDLLAGRTALIIAHRLQTLQNVDQIAVMENGELVEHGPRAELAENPETRFATLLRTAGAVGGLDEVMG